nr:hypothetical protein [uncultured Selenomonas sp.]
MPTKRKDGRYQSSVILENPITGEKVRRYFYAYTLQELEAERRRIMNANISDFLQVETFHRFADEFLTMKRDVDKLEASTLSTYQGFLTRHILPQIPPTMKIADVKPAPAEAYPRPDRRRSDEAGGLYTAAVDLSCGKVRATD